MRQKRSVCNRVGHRASKDVAGARRRPEREQHAVRRFGCRARLGAAAGRVDGGPADPLIEVGGVVADAQSSRSKVREPAEALERCGGGSGGQLGWGGCGSRGLVVELGLGGCDSRGLIVELGLGGCGGRCRLD